MACPTVSAHQIGGHLRGAIRAAMAPATPFRHWLLDDALPADAATAVVALPFVPAPIGDTAGRRETHNSARVFLAPAERGRFPVCAALATALQDRDTARLIAQTCGARLDATFLRIEYALDTDGFWLEPHTDIAAKRLTMLIYLSDHPDAEAWGTDILDHRKTLAGRSSGRFNSGLIFVPAGDTWHGFARRPIAGLRRSLIVNYVAADWRARHELAFPDQPVRAD